MIGVTEDMVEAARKAAYKAIRNEVLEEAANVCEAHRTTPGSELAETIRKMKG